MREELQNSPQESNCYEFMYLTTIKKLNSGAYLAPEHRLADLKACVRFQELTYPPYDSPTPQQIAYSNDRYRLMHEMYQKHPHPIQPPRWYRSPENELEGVYWTKCIDKYTCETHDNHLLALLGITLKSKVGRVIHLSSTDNPEVFGDKASSFD